MAKIKTQELTETERLLIVNALKALAEEAEQTDHPTTKHNAETLAERIENSEALLFTLK
jgi:hypothetical protein